MRNKNYEVEINHKRIFYKEVNYISKWMSKFITFKINQLYTLLLTKIKFYLESINKNTINNIFDTKKNMQQKNIIYKKQLTDLIFN